MGLREWLIPQDRVFFTLLENISKNVLEGTKAFVDLINEYQDVGTKRERIKDIEHAGDMLLEELWHKLNRTFITPIDREDLSKLASLYDEVLDLIYAVANRLFLYEIEEPTEVMRQFTDIVAESISEIDIAFAGLKSIDEKEIDRRCGGVDRLEEQADELLNESVARLFKEKEAMEVIKLKEIYDMLEEITDRCQDVTDILRDILIKR